MPTKNKSLKAKHFKKWYQSHKATHRANVRARNLRVIQENQEKVFAYLLEHPCVDCGEKNPVVLDFDHVTGKKTKEISIMVGGAWSWDTILAEIAKCVVRCGNCHRIKTSRDGNYARWQIWCATRDSNSQLLG